MPSSAASVRTFVVSWKEAADRNESVFSEALVIPSTISSYWACSLLAFLISALRAQQLLAVHELARQVVGVALLVDPHLLEHLAHDQLDVLVVDVDALGLVDLLDLARRGTARPWSGAPRRLPAVVEDVGRVQRALVELAALLDLLPVLDEQDASAAGTSPCAPRPPCR